MKFVSTVSSYWLVSLYATYELQSRYFCVGPHICNSIREPFWGLELKLNLSPRRFRVPQVAGSIPDGVTGIFHGHNHSCRTMALRSTQPLTEMSTRNISLGGGVKAAGA